VFADFYKEWRHAFNFVGVYIAEAHAQDKWPISSARYNGTRGPVLIPEPTTDERRCQLAAAYVRNFDFPIPMLVDPVADGFEAVFAPWPFRFYVISPTGVMLTIPEPKNCEYSMEDLRAALETHAMPTSGPEPPVSAGNAGGSGPASGS